MQPVCSLRLDHIRFKHAPAAWTRQHVRHQVRSNSAIRYRAKPAHGPVQQLPLLRRVACADAAVPNIPFPGDNQSAAMLAALSTDETSSSDSVDEPEGSKASSNGAPPPPDDDKSKVFIPHRWRIVGMMALAFVLCNMDKVATRPCLLQVTQTSTVKLAFQCLTPCVQIAGEHVSCCHTHGRGAWLERNRSWSSVFRFLLGICPDANSSRLHLHKVKLCFTEIFLQHD